MSVFIYAKRVAIAATRYDTWCADNEQGWCADMSIDAGEWSGGAIGRMQERHLSSLALNHRVLAEDVLDELSRRTHGDDPLGDWHGRNE